MPVAINYSDPAFNRILADLTAEHGKPTLTVCWIHEETAPEAALQAGAITNGIFWHVLGSAVADPAHPDRLRSQRAHFNDALPGLDYRQIVLGFRLAPDGTARWNTNAEISGDVGAGMDNDLPLNFVGIVEPWSKRP